MEVCHEADILRDILLTGGAGQSPRWYLEQSSAAALIHAQCYAHNQLSALRLYRESVPTSGP